MIIAVDGPSGSGKSSTARGVATRLGLRYLDTGATYRAVTWSALEHGLELAQHEQLDCIILDLMLPDIDGIEVCRRIRKSSDVPILMLTARDEDVDKIIGLEIGADDYLPKPFSPRELVARVRAVLRRHAGPRGAETLRVGDVSLDVPRMRVTRGSQPVDLTATQFALLAAMARHPGRVFTRSQLLDAIHGVAFESYERAIDAHVKNIRRKLEPEPRSPRYLLTVYGVGYRLAD